MHIDKPVSLCYNDNRIIGNLIFGRRDSMSTPDKSIDPRLLASAQAEFMKHGFLKAELKTICENAGITTGAVYKRYKGKEELFCAVVGDIARELTDFVESRFDMDFSALSDDDIYASWLMSYEAMIPLFRLLTMTI